MVESWTNFMRPDGGSMESSIVDGIPSLFAGIATDIIAPRLFKSLQKTDIRRHITSRRAQLNFVRDNVRVTPSRKIAGKMAINQATKKAIQNTRASYGKMIRGARAIGLGYAAVTAAQIMESVMGPGISRSAEYRDAQLGEVGLLDSGTAYTQRQRALMAIHDSQLTIRGVLGQEANFFHK